MASDSYLTVSANQSVFTVVSVARVKSGRLTYLNLHIRVIGDRIIVEYDDSIR